MPSSPTQRSLALLRSEGFTAAVCEHWNPHARIRQDLFGAFDVVAVHPTGRGVLGVQCTSGPNAAARVHKLVGNIAVRVWLEAGNSVEVWGWRKLKGKWAVRRVPITLDSLSGQDATDVQAAATAPPTPAVP